MYEIFSLYEIFSARLRHGTESLQCVEMAGSRSDLAGLAWVECKHCRYRGLGLGRQVQSHSALSLVHSQPDTRL